MGAMTYYSIASIPLLAITNKDKLYLSACYNGFLISRLFNVNIFIKNELKSNKAIIISNHVSMYDILISFIVQAYHNQVIEFCLKNIICIVPGIGWWCKIMNFLCLNRDKSDIKLIREHKTPKININLP